LNTKSPWEIYSSPDELPGLDEFRNFLYTWEASFMAKQIQELLA